MISLRNIRRFFYKTCRQPGYALRVFRKRLLAYFYYRYGNGKSSFPESITLFLTHICNLRCKMCGQWGESGITRKMSVEYIKQLLTLKELKDLIDDISPFTPNMTLFGGEPLLYPGCIELIKYIKKFRMHCLMITNGSLLEDFAKDVVDAGLDELNVSLDGDKELHDAIRGMPGLFEKITNGLKRVNRIKKEKGIEKPFINLQCTITQYNYRHLDKLIEVAKDIGADSLTYHNLIFLGKDLIERQKIYDKFLGFSSKEWEGFIFEPKIAPDELYAKITEILKERHIFSVDFYPNLSLNGIREYYNNVSNIPKEYPQRCISPWVVAYIFPDGEVRPCLNFSYSYGNIKESKFTHAPAPRSGTVRPRTTKGSGFLSCTLYGAGGFAPRSPIIEEATAVNPVRCLLSNEVKPWSFTSIWNNEKAVSFRKILKKDKFFPVCTRCTELYRY